MNTKLPLPGHSIPHNALFELMEKIDWSAPLPKIVTSLFFLPFLIVIISFPLDYKYQFAFGIIVLISGSLISKYFHNRFVSLLLMIFSSIMTLRYLYWRFTTTLDFNSPAESFLGYCLLIAELYGVSIMFLSYFQSAWPLNRKYVPLPKDTNLWPTMDVFIPTFNEPLDIVRCSVLAAQSIDWPSHKIKVHILDDGGRPTFKEFARQAGVNYIARLDHRHAKAGNLNHALNQTNGEYVTIFDCDHIPSRSFLQMTMGWFFKDPKLALIQTPHHFFSPDPIERNLDVHGHVPNEGELFYGLVQEGNDFWNASFFCGSCAILKRTALEKIGGIATDTVTEDAHTALKLSRKGYNLAYLSIPQASGLATDSFPAHIRQRTRWARGMAQIFRIDNPLLGRGLTIGQRLCYITAMMGFFYGFPRLVFLLAPLAYLLFGFEIYHAFALTVFSFAIPHVFMAQIANHKVQSQYRHSFWGEIYDTLLAPYVLLPVILAIINPKLGSFNVTVKGQTKFTKDQFDAKIAMPSIILFALNVIGAAYGIFNNILGGYGEYWTAVLNLVWVAFNLVILGACIFVAKEAKELRRTPRVDMELPATIFLPNGRTIFCSTVDFSNRGMSLKLPDGINLGPNKILDIGIFRETEEVRFKGVVRKGGNLLGVEFSPMDLDNYRKLVQVTFSRADNWAVDWGNNRKASPLKSLSELIGHGPLSPRKVMTNNKVRKV
ncbi:UDP-forming cellulose synthase catalytic subunit [Polynucleobacter kasalickyi]|uniref:Cellulose synthase catalytic subunit [UDP-forming] n=1 Tax=Polynucleobacter kasalickyi TaxID=1938817 RepID=A0A1W2A242_9BURK|nr:UDP-forming cellulose synthase catalytic subunit [Polynucleobacter kasalickyi]SMC54673.1 cellulose synthase (UDP-forming) [Polynucleobacter kasalickyi]